MMIALPRQVTCQKIMAAAREQAWSSPQQVLGLPTRLDGELEYTRHWDLTAIAEVLDHATALQWGPAELIAWDHTGVGHHFEIRRPGHSSSDPLDQVSDYLVAGADFDQMLRLAQDSIGVAGGLITGPVRRGKSDWARAMLAGAWTVTCPGRDPVCARPKDPEPSRAEAEARASEHDGLHHDGLATSEVASTRADAR